MKKKEVEMKKKKENERKGSKTSDGKKWILRFIFE